MAGGNSTDADEIGRLREELAAAKEEAKKVGDEKSLVVMQLELEKGKVKKLEQQIESMRKASVDLQSTVEQEEEYISNQLLKKIGQLQREKASLAITVEQEEEYLTNTLQKKLDQVRREKVDLENQLEVEQEFIVNRLQKELERKQNQTRSMQLQLDKLQREKVELEQVLEVEQEFMVNRLQKRLGKLENERRALQQQLLASPRLSIESTPDVAEVQRMRDLISQNEQKRQHMEEEKCRLQEENLHLKQRVQRESELIDSLSKGMTRIELEMEAEEEMHFNQMMSRSGESLHRTRSGSAASPGPSQDIDRRLSITSLASNTSGGKWWTKRSEPGLGRQQSLRRLSGSSTEPDGTGSYTASECGSYIEGKTIP
eukprot:comp20737_c0_seq1/m.27133 comp20737_c0_seq1/g.27133  ORF comp20737_c0_seq1/g.27133 comp20737_c0_seq1/m.27133 type:complete len:372 (-) comp20737_c0_seq1:26-1141(-)